MAEVLTDDDLRKMWRRAGGEFHGPNVETGDMPESKLLPFLRRLATRSQESAIRWPTEKNVERHGDMGDKGVLRIDLDSDNDVVVSTSLLHSVEFCNGGGGGGKSPKTRAALINLMSAIEEDAADSAALGVRHG